MKEESMNREIVWLDLETGGLDAHRHQVIQAALVATSATPALEIEDEMEVKVQLVEGHYETSALSVNSYDRDTWETHAVPGVQAVYQIKQFLEAHATFHRQSAKGRRYSVAFLAGHNLDFDCRFLREWFKRFNEWLPASAWAGGYLDTMHLARWWDLLCEGPWQDRVRLEDCCKLAKIKTGGHDALADVHASIELARIILAEIMS
jgi:oligoribonuclease (3'-5' exoribonuclease)